MQNDFISGSLANPEAEKCISKIIDEIETSDKVIFTMDTHFNDYLETQEGKNLPIVHCVQGTDGWKIDDRLISAVEKANIEYIPVYKVLLEQDGNRSILDLRNILKLC